MGRGRTPSPRSWWEKEGGTEGGQTLFPRSWWEKEGGDRYHPQGASGRKEEWRGADIILRSWWKKEGGTERGQKPSHGAGRSGLRSAAAATWPLVGDCGGEVRVPRVSGAWPTTRCPEWSAIWLETPTDSICHFPDLEPTVSPQQPPTARGTVSHQRPIPSPQGGLSGTVGASNCRRTVPTPSQTPRSRPT